MQPLQKRVAQPLAVPPGRLVELSGNLSGARYRTALVLLLQAQRQGETTAWVKSSTAAL
jgi:hypothetical protein